jgi:two-component system, cell cycle response regulator
MVSHRPYRSAMPSEQAIEELMRCAGTQFDPAVIDAFVLALAATRVVDEAARPRLAARS